MNGLAETLVRLLAAKGMTLAVAEASSGGALSAALTAAPGSSRVFLAGVSPYGNLAKMQLLGLPRCILDEYGAVSAEAAAAMASLVRQKTGASLGAAVTAIEGPGGGTPEKPVGTVFVAVANAHGSRAERLSLPQADARPVIRQASVEAALKLLMEFTGGREYGEYDAF